MAKKGSPEKQEMPAEKKLARKSKTDPAFERGGAFVEEHTGSATLINVDGRWDFDHPLPGRK